MNLGFQARLGSFSFGVPLSDLSALTLGGFQPALPWEAFSALGSGSSAPLSFYISRLLLLEWRPAPGE